MGKRRKPLERSRNSDLYMITAISCIFDMFTHVQRLHAQMDIVFVATTNSALFVISWSDDRW